MDKIIIAEERYGRKLNHLEDDDVIDRLNSRITIMGLMMCIFIVTGSMYIGKPINCWTPAEFKGPHDNYANSICWLKGSYYLPTEEIMIPDRSKPRIYFVAYYQWTPFILLGMALLFLIPKMVWSIFNQQGGLNIQRTVKTIKDKADSSKEEVEKTVISISTSLKSYLNRQKTARGTICCGCCQNTYYSYTFMYFIVKLLYVINTLAQFFLLNAFLSFNFTGYGVETISKLISGTDWFESRRFPRVTMCDFMVRRLGSNQHWYAVQCTLPINLFNEIIFLGIWIWLIILTILNLLSIIFWMTSLSASRRKGFLKKYLRLQREVASKKQSLPSEPTTSSTFHLLAKTETYSEFTQFLHLDGYFILRIIAHNTDDITTGKIIEQLYRTYKPSTNSDV